MVGADFTKPNLMGLSTKTVADPCPRDSVLMQVMWDTKHFVNFLLWLFWCFSTLWASSAQQIWGKSARFYLILELLTTFMCNWIRTSAYVAIGAANNSKIQHFPLGSVVYMELKWRQASRPTSSMHAFIKRQNLSPHISINCDNSVTQCSVLMEIKYYNQDSDKAANCNLHQKLCVWCFRLT